MAATEIADLMAVPYLNAEFIGETQSLVSVRVDAVYQLEFSYEEVAGKLTRINIERLRAVTHF